MAVTIHVNGTAREWDGPGAMGLLDLLRDEFGVTGPKLGCGEGACGACTVLLGARPVQACQLTAADVAGQRITTVEGLASGGILHPVQQAWLETGAFQCGYCTPGWLTGTAALLARVPHPDEARVAAELAGHACRCCCNPRIRRAVQRAAELMDTPELLEPVPAARPEAIAHPSVPVPPVPWDLSGRGPGAFAAAMPDGLLAVVAGAGDPADWTAPDEAWIHVGADGTVTAFTGKVEAGQGTRTALSLLVAEELAVRAETVALAMADTDVSPFDLGTFGSRSMPFAAPPLRAAAAAARELLREAAADRFGIPASRLTVADGMVAGPEGAPSIGYSDLLAGVRRVEKVPPGRPVTPPPAWRAAGRPARAAGGASVVTGAKRFPADLRADGMLHGCVLRPPAFGATLRAADTTAAEALPGVSVVRDGEFIGVVAATSAAARRGVAAIEAEWDRSPQPGTDELAGYLRSHPIDGEGFSAAFRHEEGDVDAALAAGPVRVTAQYTAAYIAHVPLEARSAIAAWRDGHLTVWTGTSTPFRARGELARALGV